MKKKIGIILTALVVCTSMIVTGSTEVIEKVDYKVKKGDEEIGFSDTIFTSNDKMYVPLRELCEELRIPLEWNEEREEAVMEINNKKIEVSDKTEYKEEGVIPDEETALAIGKIILEKYVGKRLEYETEEEIFYLYASYDQEANCWIIGQDMKYKDGRLLIFGDGNGSYIPEVILNKNTGEVIYINTRNYFESLTTK